MSFILQALKKVERQHAEAKSGLLSNRTTKRELKHRWPWVVALLLTAGAMLSVGILVGRSDKPQQPAVSTVQPIAPPAAKPLPGTKPVLAAPQKRAVIEIVEPEPDVVKDPMPVLVIEHSPEPIPHNDIPDQLSKLPGNLPVMNIDIHSVSQESPAKSYVLINMKRYRVGDRTDEGAVVADIVADGAILEYQGSHFLLPLY